MIALLPSDNRKANKIFISNIQDLCTALETAYPNGKRGKDILIEELKKEIKETIESFEQKHNSIDVDKQTTLHSCFQHLDFTLRQKILTMYNENKDFIDPIVEKNNLPLMNEENIGAFVKLRNNKTHKGIFKLGEYVHIYPALFALVYIQLFKATPHNAPEKCSSIQH